MSNSWDCFEDEELLDEEHVAFRVCVACFGALSGDAHPAWPRCDCNPLRGGSSLIGPERSEGPSLARRRQSTIPASPTAAGDTPCKSALFGENGSEALVQEIPAHGARGDGGRR